MYINYYILCYANKVTTVLVNNSTNIIKTNYHLSPQTIEHKNKKIYDERWKIRSCLVFALCVADLLVFTDIGGFFSLIFYFLHTNLSNHLIWNIMINLIMIIIVTFNGKRKAIFHWLKSKILVLIVLKEAHCLSAELLLGYFF